MPVIKKAEILLGIHLKELGLQYVTDYQFDPDRQWKADFHIREHNLLIEVEGGVYVKGRHTRGRGFEDDCRKYNTAVLKHAYKLVRFTTGMVESGEAKEFLSEMLFWKRGKP